MALLWRELVSLWFTFENSAKCTEIAFHLDSFVEKRKYVFNVRVNIFNDT